MDAPHPVDGFVADEPTIFGWIETVVAEGIRRPGHPADEWCEQWVAQRVRDIGLDDVTLEPVDLPLWDFRSAALTVWPSGSPSRAVTFDAFALPYTQPTDGLEAELSPFPGGESEARIAVEQLELMRLPQVFTREMATAVHDPAGEFDHLVQVLPFGPRIRDLLVPVVDAGAAGYVGVLSGVPWETHDYYVPYDGIERALPAVWIGAAAGRELARLMGAGPVTGRIAVDADCRPARSHNVTGTLPGASNEWVIIGSHHDAPWASAVEDGSGIALVLAQAAYWARVVPADRPHNLLFLLNAGHMAGGAGVLAFCDAHADLLTRTVLELHLEHAAVECSTENDRLVPTGEPEVRWWFTSREPGLEAAVGTALAEEDLGRSLVFPPEVFFEHPPTDGGVFHMHGVPLVNFLAAPMYLFDSADTLDKIHRPSLVPITRAGVRIVASLAGRSAAELRDGVIADEMTGARQRPA